MNIYDIQGVNWDNESNSKLYGDELYKYKNKLGKYNALKT